MSSFQPLEHQAQGHLCTSASIVLHLLRHPPPLHLLTPRAGGRLSALCCQPETAVWPGSRSRRWSARLKEGEAIIRPILGSAAAVIHNCASCLAKECPQNPPPSRHPANGTQRGSLWALSHLSPPPRAALLNRLYHPKPAPASGGSRSPYSSRRPRQIFPL